MPWHFAALETCARFLLYGLDTFAMFFAKLEMPSTPCASNAHVPEPHTRVPHTHAVRASSQSIQGSRVAAKNFAPFSRFRASRCA
jgi:hypothetical protein